MILYMYDLKSKNLKAYNTLKRRFYYQLGKSNISNSPFKTKSVILVKESLEKEADAFFSKWRGGITVFKSGPTEVERLV